MMPVFSGLAFSKQLSVCDWRSIGRPMISALASHGRFEH